MQIKLFFTGDRCNPVQFNCYMKWCFRGDQCYPVQAVQLLEVLKDETYIAKNLSSSQQYIRIMRNQEINRDHSKYKLREDSNPDAAFYHTSMQTQRIHFFVIVQASKSVKIRTKALIQKRPQWAPLDIQNNKSTFQGINLVQLKRIPFFSLKEC